MENEQQQQEQQKTENTSDVDYIKVISDLKHNSVPIEKYNKLKEDNQKLLNSFVNGEDIQKPNKPEKVDVAQIRESMFGVKAKQMTNLEFIDNALKLRKQILDDGGADIFVPSGHKVQTTHNDYESAQRVAKVLQECVDYADGNSEVFTDELKRRIK